MPTILPGAGPRGPFLIGFQQQNIDGELRNEPVIHVDMDHPRIAGSEAGAVKRGLAECSCRTAGIAPTWNTSPAVLRGIRDGADAGKSIFAAFDDGPDPADECRTEVRRRARRQT